MEVQEAFIKIREQSKAQLGLPGALHTGLAALSSATLEYFMPARKVGA